MIISGPIAFVAMVLASKDILKIMPFSEQLSDGTQIFSATDIIIALGLVLAGIIILIGLWGCSLTCMNSKWCLGPFALIILVISLTYGIIGAVLVAQGVNGFDYV